ncbi:fumarylacetoacetate hydrolase family protein [Pusillimonas sp.]|uniref:fumarylacetoacetate hydrolase family protein n=1 Tax=Pusillimonas sp. TaxID=3040095 RepID=UPI0029A21E4A|nr:fumarylacetoacetate hydrolase family protein [Pusillimonas sp.]MDX3895614.1 fumarylacetoacetate hydrolase family protein [Pusillimonas sp.]
MHAPKNPALQAGTVYGVVLNDRGSVERMGAALTEAPYKAEPKAPILYIKPANTFAADGAQVILPGGAEKVEIGATLGVVMGRPASRVALEDAYAFIAGYIVAADLSLPHASYYRPAIREKCFDGSCILGAPVAASRVSDPAGLNIRTTINSIDADQFDLAGLVRGVPELLRDVSEFMTLSAGDVLLVGVKWQAPTAAPGDHVSVVSDVLGKIHFSIVPARHREAA